MTKEGTIIQGRGGLYTVRDQQGQEFILRAKNKFRREGRVPLVGDQVAFTPAYQDEHGWLEEIHPRRSYTIRPPVANLSLLIVTLAPEPVADLLLLDKQLAFAKGQQIDCLIAVNKADLAPGLADAFQEAYLQTGIEVLAVSAAVGTGLSQLKTRMKGHRCCFSGQSGVGKSSLVAALTGQEALAGEISPRIRRGRQTTRHTSLMYADGYEVFDTPGFSLMELPGDMEPEELQQMYPEFLPLLGQCRFQPCLHDREPDCSIQNASANGQIDAGRLSRYRTLLHQLQENRRNRYD